ncbi:MAG: putative non-heme bromoperoxidase BpoC [bacterium ADurb.Bin157]|nr:MAG: putative non-heme bromoperoxidase BpoC [bacterium ADurb.Bin157]
MKYLKQFLFAIILLSLLTGCSLSQNSDSDDTSEGFLISDLPLRHAAVNGASIAYKELGIGEPLLLIAGIGADMSMFNETFVRALANRYRVILFDYRGLGASNDPGPAFSMEMLTKDAADLLSALKISKANIFGSSMGASIAQELALLYPEKVSRLVLSSPTYSITAPGAEALNAMIHGIVNDLAVPITVRKQAEANLNWSGTYDRLKNITNKTLLLAGTEDNLIPSAIAADMQPKLINAQLTVIDGAKHSGERYMPSEYAKIIMRFLS